VQAGGLVIAEHHASVVKERRRLLDGQRQISWTDLQDPALGAQPRDAWQRVGTSGYDQPRTGRDMIGQNRQRRQAFPVMQHVHVV
jgi:hypothetical protein